MIWTITIIKLVILSSLHSKDVGKALTALKYHSKSNKLFENDDAL